MFMKLGKENDGSEKALGQHHVRKETGEILAQNATRNSWI
jgi:hypothetical protein